MTGVGRNVQWSYCHDARKAAIRGYMATTQPDAMLFLSSFGEDRADVIGISQTRPGKVTVYRRYYGDDVRKRLSVAQWAEHHQPFAGTDVFCSTDNEPPFIDSLDWQNAVIDAARRLDIRVSVGGYSVGTPEVRPDFGDLPRAESLIRRASADRENILIDLHEYFPPLWTVDFNRDARNPSQWPARVSSVIDLHLGGRFRQWLFYADSLGIPRPRIVIGEFGHDYIEAVKSQYPAPLGPIMRNVDLWRGWGFADWEAYAAAQLQAAWVAIYRDYPDVAGACLFTDHSTPGVWHEHNYSRAPRLLALTSEGFNRMTTPPAPSIPPFAVGTYTMADAPQGYINIRSTANGADIGNVDNGATVVITAVEVSPIVGVYRWQKVSVNGVPGWIALTGAYKLNPKMAKAEFLQRARALNDKYHADMTALLNEYEQTSE